MNEWIPERGVNGEYGYVNTKTGEFRTTIPGSDQEKQERIYKQNQASIKEYSSRLAEFDRTDANVRNYPDERIQKSINVPIISMKPDGSFTNNYIQASAPYESSLQIVSPELSLLASGKVISNLKHLTNKIPLTFEKAIASDQLARTAALTPGGYFGTLLPNVTTPILSGEIVEKTVKSATGKSIGQNINQVTGVIPESVGEFINPGYLIGSQFYSKLISKGIKNWKGLNYRLVKPSNNLTIGRELNLNVNNQNKEVVPWVNYNQPFLSRLKDQSVHNRFLQLFDEAYSRAPESRSILDKVFTKDEIKSAKNLYVSNREAVLNNTQNIRFIESNNPSNLGTYYPSENMIEIYTNNGLTPKQNMEIIYPHETVHSLISQSKLLGSGEGIFGKKGTSATGYLGRAEEHYTRGTQLKNYFNITNGSELTPEQLWYARRNYIKDTGVDNNMEDWFQSTIDHFDETTGLLKDPQLNFGFSNIKDYAKDLSKYSLVAAPFILKFNQNTQK